MKAEKMYLNRWQKIVCMIPYRWPNGRMGTEVLFETGDREWLKVGCSVAADHLAMCFFTTSGLTRRRAEHWLGDATRRRLPLVFHREFCLVPLTFAEGQGYIVQKKLRDIRCLMAPKHGTRLFFYKLQEWVDIPQSSFTVNKQMQLSYQLLDYYLDEEI